MMIGFPWTSMYAPPAAAAWPPASGDAGIAGPCAKPSLVDPSASPAATSAAAERFRSDLIRAFPLVRRVGSARPRFRGTAGRRSSAVGRLTRPPPAEYRCGKQLPAAPHEALR